MKTKSCSPAQKIFGALWSAAFLVILAGCVSAPESFPETLTLPSGETVALRLAVTAAEKAQGLSGLQPKEFEEHEGMLFVYDETAPRSFWMPDTYFDLDIFFLDENFTVTHVKRSVPHHPGRDEPPPIARTESVPARYVLEMRADSEVAEEIDSGTKLQFK